MRVSIGPPPEGAGCANYEARRNVAQRTVWCPRTRKNHSDVCDWDHKHVACRGASFRARPAACIQRPDLVAARPLSPLHDVTQLNARAKENLHVIQTQRPSDARAFATTRDRSRRSIGAPHNPRRLTARRIWLGTRPARRPRLTSTPRRCSAFRRAFRPQSTSGLSAHRSMTRASSAVVPATASLARSSLIRRAGHDRIHALAPFHLLQRARDRGYSQPGCRRPDP